MKALGTLCVLMLCFLVCQGQIKKFKSNFQAQELDIDGRTVIRSYVGIFYYEDTWNSIDNSGHQAMRFDISLNDGTTSRTLTQLYVYEDQFFKYTICGGKCAWQDLFAEEPLPKLYIQSGDTPSGPSTTINSVAVTPYIFSSENAINVNYANWNKLWVRSAAPQYPVRVELTYTSSSIIQRIDFTSQDSAFSSSVFNVPSGCPSIEPGCFRIDLSLVLDISGSVGPDGLQEGLDFISNLLNRFLIGPKNVQASLTSFSYCYRTRQLFPMLSNKTEILDNLNAYRQTLVSDGLTCIVGGIRQGFLNWNFQNGGRPATRKALIVVTDGNGNRPCSTTLVESNTDEDCGAWDTKIVTEVAPICASDGGTRASPCNAGLCCQAIHDWQLKMFYANNYNASLPTIYAVGVGTSSDISDSTLRLIVNDPIAIARGDPRVFRADSWSALNSIIVALAKAVLCDVEGSEICPNDCRPGGFCCAGGCLCTIDCSQLSSECQAGTCYVDSTGSRCTLGAPDNSSCQDPRIQCQNRFCVAGEGCKGVPDNTKQCTDHNLCTDDICSGGTCVSTTNPNVLNCDDHNGCTKNDVCVGDGKCAGIPDDTNNCTDGNACTVDSCYNTTCVSVPGVECIDADTSDCLYPVCDPLTGLCVPVPIEPGFQCAPSNPRDNCTIYICDRFDPDDYIICIQNGNADKCNTGTCKKATRDSDDCGSSDVNVAAIIGGVIAGVAFLAILALIIIIVIIFLLRNQVATAMGTLTPFGKDMVVHDNPTHVSPITTHTVPDLT